MGSGKFGWQKAAAKDAAKRRLSIGTRRRIPKAKVSLFAPYTHEQYTADVKALKLTLSGRKLSEAIAELRRRRSANT